MGLRAIGRVIDGKHVRLNDELLSMVDLNHGDYLMMNIYQVVKKKDVIETDDTQLWDGLDQDNFE